MKRIFNIHFFLLIIITNFFLPACGQIKNKATPSTSADSLQATVKEWNKTIPGGFSAQTKLAFNNTQITDFLKQYPLFNKYAGSIKKFYSLRHNTYAWFDDDHLIEQAGNLFDRVTNIR